MAAKKIDSLNIIGQDTSSRSSKSESGMTRREFLKVTGTAAAAVGAVGCADPATQNILPYLNGPEESVPGVASWFASTCTECSAGCGIQVKTREGRAIKIEGSKENPINRGGLCAQGQAALQGLYDPDRVREPLKREANDKGKQILSPVSWNAAFSKISKALGKNKGKVAIVTGSLGTAESKLVKEWASAMNAEHVVYDAGAQNAVAMGAELAFGVKGIPGYKFEKADLVVNFGADFLESWISPCEYARGWAEARKNNQLKLVHIEPRLSLTGANADKWLTLQARKRSFNC
ncbi:MAG: molybdopterin-dependent oxidoreductase [Bdellovibrionota bacterium]